MDLTLASQEAEGFCLICNCLGFFHTHGPNKLQHSSLVILSDRSFDQFSESAKQGCCFCDVVQQSFQLLQYIAVEMRVDLLLYGQSPAELHASADKGIHEVVEIYSRPTTNTRQNYPIVGNDVDEKSSLDASVQFLRENFYSCKTEHEKCRNPQCAYLPKRIVDISKPRYRVFEPAAHTEGVYATLSYSWGGRGFAMTTSGNYEEMKHGFDRGALPDTFQDAAAMAQSLDIYYIWIDTLCIVQDDPADWEEQAAEMAQIFEGAAITIAASLSTDPYQTLFTARKPTNQEVELYSEVKGVVFKARRKIVRGIHAKIGRSREVDPLDTRAWGLQEKMLSRRLIAFTGAELQWTCKTLKACECHHSTSPSPPLFPTPTGTTTANDILKLSKSWSQIIEEYSTRELRYFTDKLPALGGLASKFESVTGWTYITGGWKETILYDLVWQRDVGPTVSSTGQLGPSFSWASSPGAVNFRLARHSYPGSRIEHTTLVDLHYTSAGSHENSKAPDTWLMVRGHTVPAVLRRSSHGFQAYTIRIDDATYSPGTDQRTTCEFSIDASIPEYNAKIPQVSGNRPREGLNGPGDQDEELSIVLLSLYSIHHRRHLYHNFLILERLHDHVDSYRRIGVGTGKMYPGRGCEDGFPSEPHLVRPFGWLLRDVEKGGRRFTNIVERVLRVR